MVPFGPTPVPPPNAGFPRRDRGDALNHGVTALDRGAGFRQENAALHGAKLTQLMVPDFPGPIARSAAVSRCA